MDANRFYSVPFDARNNSKILRLRKVSGGIVAFGRWMALLGILYDAGGTIDLTDEAMRSVIADELELEDVDQFCTDLASCGLIDGEIYRATNHVTSKGVCDEIEYRKGRVEAGRKSGESRRKKAK